MVIADYARAMLIFTAMGFSLGRTANVTADFGKGAGYPLNKSKINLYTTAIPSTKNFERDIPWLAKLRPEVLRLEFFWGMDQSLSRTVSGTADKPLYDWALIDHWQKLVTDQGSLVQWGYGYTPFSLTKGDTSHNAFKTPPPADPWKRIVTDVATHLKGGPITYHEIWNEPNFDWFWTGGPQDYFKLYENTALAIKAVNPDAKVGGPTVSLPDWYQGFVQYVQAKNLPLDFFSYHNYGEMAHPWTTTVNELLAADPRFVRTETSLDEYNIYHTWPVGSLQDRFEGANDMLQSFLGFLDRPELTSMFWAQFMDPCDCGGLERLGLLDLNGHRKATYNAFRIWAMMPVDRNAVTSDVDNLVAVASSDPDHGGLLLLNRTGSDQNVTVNFRNLAFATGQIQVYRIDKTHNSFGDGANEDLTAVQTLPNAALANWTWTGSLPRMGILYFDADDGTKLSLLTENPVARIIHVNHYYPERGKTKSYSEFDRRTWIARLGMGGSDFADQEIGVTAEGLPASLDFKFRIEGAPARKDANSLIGLRIDYQGTGGAYASSVLFHGPYKGSPDLYDAARTSPMPYGTLKAPGQAVAVADLAGFSVELAKYAPPGWTGRAQLLFIMQNAGAAARAVVEVHAPAASGILSRMPDGNGRSLAQLLAHSETGTLEVLNIGGANVLRLSRPGNAAGTSWLQEGLNDAGIAPGTYLLRWREEGGVRYSPISLKR